MVPGCPNCKIGRQVEEAIATHGFWRTLLLVTLPLLVLTVLAALVHRVGERRARDLRRR